MQCKSSVISGKEVHYDTKSQKGLEPVSNAQSNSFGHGIHYVTKEAKTVIEPFSNLVVPTFLHRQSTKKLERFGTIQQPGHWLHFFHLQQCRHFGHTVLLCYKKAGNPSACTCWWMVSVSSSSAIRLPYLDGFVVFKSCGGNQVFCWVASCAKYHICVSL